ncbi:MAG: DUF1816 domain-containing protein [Cyanobacteriota bacterium]|nr:DUF1816 domain-containing protein [Cyanobacteriota bacterium]
MKEILVKGLELLGMAWWAEITTETPKCTYYFGPFTSQSEAELASAGYIEDLKQEGAMGIAIKIGRMKPSELTIADDLGEISDRDRLPAFGGQLL